MDQANYFWTHPPRCLDGFQKQKAALESVNFDGHGQQINTIFRVNCTCGHANHLVLGQYWRNSDNKNVQVFLNPIDLRCESCGKTTELIDTNVHGYDGELGHGSAIMRGEGELVEFVCVKCGDHPFQLYARFEYPNDLFEDDFADFEGRQQDLFTWFSLVGTCSNCSELDQICNFECA